MNEPQDIRPFRNGTVTRGPHAVYINIDRGVELDIKQTLEVTSNVLVDIDHANNIVGIEVLL